jgi:signal transduction histidine kinase
MKLLKTIFFPSRRVNELDMTELRSMMVDRSLTIALLLIVPGIFLSLLNLSSVDWSIFSVIEILVVVIIAFLGIFRQRLPYTFRTYGLISALFVMAMTEFAGWGLSGTGGIWFLITIFGTYVLISHRAAVRLTASGLLFVLMVAIGTRIGLYNYQLDFNQYAYSIEGWLGHWLTILIGMIAFLGMIQFIFWYLGKKISELSEQRQTLQQAADQLRKEIFEHTQTSRDLEIALENLREIDVMKDQFVSNVSHELRTPIANLRLYTQLVEKRPEKAREYMQTMTKEISRLDNIVEQMLYMAKIQDSAEFGTWVQFDLQAVIKAVIDQYMPTAIGRGMTMSFRPLEQMPLFFGSSNMMYQLIRSLVDNAIKYSPTGGDIVIEALQQDGHPYHQVGFRITNTGVGIDRYERDKVFERFFRGKIAMERHVSGAGLGLATARQITSIHHGNISLDNSDQQRVTFTVMMPTLPIAQPETTPGQNSVPA